MRKWIIIIAVAAMFLGGVLVTSSQWDGDITEAAADPLAVEAGAEEAHLLPWSIEGDLLLFLFLTGGATAGFVVGYNWRKLFPGKSTVDDSKLSESGRVGRGIT